MKLLLDENMPHDFRHYLPGHDVRTVEKSSTYQHKRVFDRLGLGRLKPAELGPLRVA